MTTYLPQGYPLWIQQYDRESHSAVGTPQPIIAWVDLSGDSLTPVTPYGILDYTDQYAIGATPQEARETTRRVFNPSQDVDHLESLRREMEDRGLL